MLTVNNNNKNNKTKSLDIYIGFILKGHFSQINILDVLIE